MVTYDAVNGRMGTLGKFEYYLYAQNLLYHGILNATLNRIANTIVHWAIEWLYYYENWVYTGKWLGGGHGNWDADYTIKDNQHSD